MFSAFAVFVANSAIAASTYDYFTIHAKNNRPIYTQETIQIEGVTNVETPVVNEIKTPEVKPVTTPSQPAVVNEVKKVVEPQALTVEPELKPAAKVETPVVTTQKQVQQPVQPKVEPATTVKAIAKQEPKVEEDSIKGEVVETATNVHFGKSLTNPQAETKLNQLGTNLIKNARLKSKVQFIFSPDTTINAYAHISGKITVFRGLLDYCELEDELAFVVGHELSHIENKDSLKQTIANETIDAGGSVAAHYAKKKISTKLRNNLNVFGINADAAATNAIGTVQTAASAKYSRMHESRADQCAIDYVVKSGYNPLAGISIMYKIGDNYEDLFEDHPSTEKRLQNMYNYVAKKYPQYLKKGFSTEAYKEAYLNIEK